jgi:hypothetical protein
LPWAGYIQLCRQVLQPCETMQALQPHLQRI